uniref:Uncharacterized protein n=1 Tax=Picea glauca TaxID=3330 RepID=A0A101M435_PICGL|nr:hypothetical protein ABT39_MTgene381 [Picea glauca]
MAHLTSEGEVGRGRMARLTKESEVIISYKHA